MANTLGKFYFECDARGGTLKAIPTLSTICVSDGEVDYYVRMLKEDLDSVAKKLNSAIKKRPALLANHESQPPLI